MANKKNKTLGSLASSIISLRDKVADPLKKATETIAPAVQKVSDNMPNSYNGNTVGNAVDYAIAAASRPKQFNYDDPALKKYYDRLMNRKDFSFDLNGNALWNQYKDHYTKLGQMAMADTVGQTSALTGGYGNSWAQSAGQQAYQQNLESLNSIIPELYQLALQQYQAEGDELMSRYAVASGERDFAYGQYRDSVSDWKDDRTFEYGKFTDARDFDYQQERDKVEDEQWGKEFDWQKKTDERDFKYQQGRDKVEDEQWGKEFDWQVETDKRDYNLEVEKKKFDEWYRKKSIELDEAAQKASNKYQQQQIDLERDKLEETKRQADMDYQIEKAQLNETIRQHNLQSGKTSSSGRKSGGTDSGYIVAENNSPKAPDDKDEYGWADVKATSKLSKTAQAADNSVQYRGISDTEIQITNLLRSVANKSIKPGEAKYIATKLYNSIQNDTRLSDKEKKSKRKYINEQFGNSLG